MFKIADKAELASIVSELRHKICISDLKTLHIFTIFQQNFIKIKMERIKVESLNGFRIITLSNPSTLNALDSKTISELDGLLDELAGEDGLRGFVITGEGKAFSAGADISELLKLDSYHSAYEYLRRGQRVLEKLENFKVPSVALINGWALGGGFELALACTFRVAVEGAKVGLPEINLGIIPGYGGTQRLARLVGKRKAIWLITSGKFVEAKEALELGIVDKVVKDRDEGMDVSISILEELSEKHITALRYAIWAVRAEGQPDGFEYEALLCASLIASAQAKEKMKNFLEKRKKKS